MTKRPQPIPYQGSKRQIADQILPYIPRGVRCLYEPFAGSAALTIAAADRGLAEAYHINDVLGPLVQIWEGILHTPHQLAEAYQALWEAQLHDPKAFYLATRHTFNHDHDPAKLLYLLARCVKNAVRFNASGEFNQSADHRRKGRRPDRMRHEILAAHALLRGKTTTSVDDYAKVLQRAEPTDFVYMDPPYAGTSYGHDTRYYQSLTLDPFVESLRYLLERGIPFLVSFDGRTGERTYGPGLPKQLGLTQVEIDAGVSSQATLNGVRARTFESLYASPNLLQAK
ncbi:MAG: DNA adenine methylase [Myxococcota bacterium]